MDIRLHVPRPASNTVYKFVTDLEPLKFLPLQFPPRQIADFASLFVYCRFVFGNGQLSGTKDELDPRRVDSFGDVEIID